MNADSSLLRPSDRAGGHGPAFILSLANGTRLALCAGDESAASVLNFLSRAARLSPASNPLPSGTRRLLVVTAVGRSDVSSSGSGADIVFRLEPTDSPQPRRWRQNPTAISESLTPEQWQCQQLVRLSTCIAHEAQPGGVLLHSGLASLPSPSPPRGGTEWGVLLAGRSGVGKSTAARRLPPPWRALADEGTLIVKDKKGVYWAHPWLTWSRFFGPGKEDGCDAREVQRAVPLRAIFILEQGAADRVEPLGAGRAVALLAELARQTAAHFLHGLPPGEIAAFNRRRFENLCALAHSVPAYALAVSLTGAFWEEIARTMR